MRQLAGVVLVLFAACGDNVHGVASAPLDDTAPDAAAIVPNDAAIDAIADAPPDGSYIRPCDYIEQQDLTNDYKQVPGAAEDTPWGVGSFPYPSGFVLCGNINAGHYNPTFNSIDIDRFTFSVGLTSNMVIKFSGDAFWISSLGTGAGTVGVFVYDYATGSTLYMGSNFQYDTATFTGTLPPGEYDISVEAYDTQEDIGLSVPYALEIIAYCTLDGCLTSYPPGATP
jgi:hypothetical protein